MNRKELTKPFVLISNWKKPFVLHGLYKNYFSVIRVNFETHNVTFDTTDWIGKARRSSSFTDFVPFHLSICAVYVFLYNTMSSLLWYNRGSFHFYITAETNLPIFIISIIYQAFLWRISIMHCVWWFVWCSWQRQCSSISFLGFMHTNIYNNCTNMKL